MMKAVRQATTTLPDLLANLQLDRYLVQDLVFKCNKTVTTNKDELATPTIGIDFDVKENTKDKNKFLLDMVVDLNEGQDFDKFETYQIHLNILGWFHFSSELDDKAKAKMLTGNASAMLYGVARTVVASITGSLGANRYILPALNLLSVIKAKAEERQRRAGAADPMVSKPKGKRSSPA